jgi:hypothetical protein
MAESISSSSDGDSDSKKRKRSKDHKSEKKHKKEKKDKKESHEEIAKDQQISEEDYYLKSSEFKYWLRTQKKITFDTLTSSKSKKLFGNFVKLWNSKRLSQDFYTGLTLEARADASSYTQHKWGFAKNLSKQDSRVLEAAKDSVQVATNTGDEPGNTKRRREGHLKSELNATSWNAATELVREHQEREAEKLNELRKSLGLKPGQKITIAPRPSLI